MSTLSSFQFIGFFSFEKSECLRIFVALIPRQKPIHSNKFVSCNSSPVWSCCLCEHWCRNMRLIWKPSGTFQLWHGKSTNETLSALHPQTLFISCKWLWRAEHTYFLEVLAVVMRSLRLIFTFTLVLQSRTFELQDTIHKLIEENIYLHDQLENLTKALRELKWMLIHHSTGTAFKSPLL